MYVCQFCHRRMWEGTKCIIIIVRVTLLAPVQQQQQLRRVCFLLCWMNQRANRAKEQVVLLLCVVPAGHTYHSSCLPSTPGVRPSRYIHTSLQRKENLEVLFFS